MRFTIREYGTNSVTVDYADGSWAVVPLYEDVLNSKGTIATHIAQWGPRRPVTWVLDPAIPVGAEVDTDAAEYQVRHANVEADEVTWVDARRNLYPGFDEQADAAYWARNGSPRLQQNIDAEIARVKELVPKTWATRSRAEYVAWLETIE